MRFLTVFSGREGRTSGRVCASHPGYVVRAAALLFQRQRGLEEVEGGLPLCRRAGNAGVLPSVVLAESYAIIRRDAGREVAEHRFNELVDSGLKVVPLSPDMARESGVIRAKYHEKIPWGDCLIAGTHILEKADVILSEDPHFREIAEVKAKTLAQFKI